jgi:hypothetical protein
MKMADRVWLEMACFIVMSSKMEFLKMKEHWPLFPKDFPKYGVSFIVLDRVVGPGFSYFFCWSFV